MVKRRSTRPVDTWPFMALKLSQALYDNGYISYLEVIVQQTNLFEAQLDESSTMQQKLNSIVLLYKALGGGWNTQ